MSGYKISSTGYRHEGAPLYRDERGGLPRPVLFCGQMGEGCRRAPRGIKT